MYLSSFILLITSILTWFAQTACQDPSMYMTPLQEWIYDPIMTVGEPIGDYYPPGVGDGLGGFRDDKTKTVVIFSNHEISHNISYPYSLKNGVKLRGARVTRYVFTLTGKLQSAGLAYDTIYDREGKIVKSANQVSEFPSGYVDSGFTRFCSASMYMGGSSGFVDDLFITAEESSQLFGSPHGGSFWALDPHTNTLWGLPDLGRGSWENAGSIYISDEHIGLILTYDGDGVSPLFLYVGKKKVDSTSILERNGLSGGTVYVWVSDSGEDDMPSFSGTGANMWGSFVPVSIRDISKSGQVGYDQQGYLDEYTLLAAAKEVGAFQFSRTEDVSVNPLNSSQSIFSLTGVGFMYPSTNWGSIVQLDLDSRDVMKLRAKLTIIHDGGDPQFQDFGVRSPDNLYWSTNARYVVEDMSTMLKTPLGGCEIAPNKTKCYDYAFGGRSQIEASVWEISQTGDTKTVLDLQRIAVINRNVTMPEGSVDIAAGFIGYWETSGVRRISQLFDYPGKMLVANVQAHTIRNGVITTRDLAEGGQFFFLYKLAENVSVETKVKVKTNKRYTPTEHPHLKEKDSNQIEISVKNEDVFTVGSVEVYFDYKKADLKLPEECFWRGESRYGCEVFNLGSGKTYKFKITAKKVSNEELLHLDVYANIWFGEQSSSLLVEHQDVKIKI